MSRTKEVKEFKIKKRVPKGTCRIIENGEGCNRSTHCRGLCPKHHTYILRYNQIKKYGAPSEFVYVKDAKYKVNKKQKPGKCRLIENGTQCNSKMHGRGLCARHWLTLDRNGLLLKYGTSSRKDPRTFEKKRKIVKGKCLVVENGKGCKNSSISRGCCSKHYLRFLRRGSFKLRVVKK